VLHKLKKLKTHVGSLIPPVCDSQPRRVAFLFSSFLIIPLLPFFILAVRFNLIECFKLRADRIGHFVPDSIELIDAVHHSKALLKLFFCTTRISNYYWLEIIQECSTVKRSLSVVPLCFLSDIFCITGVWVRTNYNNSRLSQELLAQPSARMFQKTALEKIQRDFEKSMINLPIDLTKPWYVVSARDQMFSESYIKAKGDEIDHHQKRNVPIALFASGIRALIRNDIQVIRVGREGPPAGIRHHSFYDYACSSIRSDFIDVYLHSFCKACVSTSFGPDWIPVVFGKPLLHVCFGDSAGFYSFTKTMHAPNLLMKVRTKQIVNISEWIDCMKPSINLTNLTDRFIVKNLPNDLIKKIFEEFINFVADEWSESSESKKLHSEIFKHEYLKRLDRYSEPTKPSVVSNEWALFFNRSIHKN
jgi:putative glycosyltransferase (TIGR04372 family)